MYNFICLLISKIHWKLTHETASQTQEKFRVFNLINVATPLKVPGKVSKTVHKKTDRTWDLKRDETVELFQIAYSDVPLLRLSSDPDEYSSSEQSCDTVIYVGPNGAAVSDRELTDNEGPPEFVPIIPALLRGKASEQQQTQSQTAGAQNKVSQTYVFIWSADN